MELGGKIRTLRRQQRMTLDELSKKSKVSKSLLSHVERNISVPTVRTLGRITEALGTTVSRIYLEMEGAEKSGENSGRVSVVHKNERKKMVLGPERGRARFELLSPDYQRKIEFLYVHFPVGGKFGNFIRHEGEECGTILEGRLKACIGDRVIILEEGDSIYFDSSIPHRLENIGEIEVRAFWTSTPPSF